MNQSAEQILEKEIDRFNREIQMYSDEIESLKNRIESHVDLISVSKQARDALAKALDAVRSDVR